MKNPSYNSWSYWKVFTNLLQKRFIGSIVPYKQDLQPCYKKILIIHRYHIFDVTKYNLRQLIYGKAQNLVRRFRHHLLKELHIIDFEPLLLTYTNTCIHYNSYTNKCHYSILRPYLQNLPNWIPEWTPYHHPNSKPHVKPTICPIVLGWDMQYMMARVADDAMVECNTKDMTYRQITQCLRADRR